MIWTERQAAGDNNMLWHNVSLDDLGTHVLALCGDTTLVNSGVYLSADGGETWECYHPNGLSSRTWWQCGALSANGSVVGAGVQEQDAGYGLEQGYVYISADSGATWPNHSWLGYWYDLASDSSGTRLIAASGYTANYGYLITSADGGATWTERQPAGGISIFWRSAASSDDGSRLVVCSVVRLYSSSNYGVTWTELQPLGNTDQLYGELAMDADGSHIIISILNASGAGRLFTSSDYGANWTERTPSGSGSMSWWSTASNADGSVLIVGSRSVAGHGLGEVYVSTDGGESWTVQPLDNAINCWETVAVSVTGTYFAAACDNGRLYTAGVITAPPVAHLFPWLGRFQLCHKVT